MIQRKLRQTMTVGLGRSIPRVLFLERAIDVQSAKLPLGDMRRLGLRSIGHGHAVRGAGRVAGAGGQIIRC